MVADKIDKYFFILFAILRLAADAAESLYDKATQVTVECTEWT